MIRFTIPAMPVAEPRKRTRIVAAGGRQFASHYTPKDSPANVFKATARMAAQQAYQGHQLAGPLRVDLVFVFPRPGRLVWKKRPMPRAWHSSKPDRDNLDKCVLDSFKGRLWIDDCQVCAGSIEKWYAAGDEQPHVEVTITELEAAC